MADDDGLASLADRQPADSTVDTAGSELLTNDVGMAPERWQVEVEDDEEEAEGGGGSSGGGLL